MIAPLPPSFSLLMRFCATLGALAIVAAGMWLMLEALWRHVPASALRSLLQDVTLGPFVSMLATIALVVGSMMAWGACRCRRGDRGGRKILVAAIALAHGVGFIVTMVQFTWLPNVLKALNPDANPYSNLVQCQHLVLKASGLVWMLVVLFDIALGYVMTRRSVNTLFVE